MLSQKQLSTCFLIIILFSLLSCSADKKEYEKIQLQITNAENVASSTNDYDVQLKACDNSIKTLQEYIAKYPNSDWTESAKLSLASWESKKKSFELKADENAYKKINAVIEESEKIIKSSYDFDIIFDAYKNIFNTLDGFISQYQNSEWIEQAELSLSSWKTKAVSFNNEVLQLKSSLNQKLEKKCIDAANKHHGMSKIEELTLEKDSTTKSGDILKTVHTYRVKMRGKILGTHVFNFQIKVTGNTNMRTKTISVDDKTKIIE